MHNEKVIDKTASAYAQELERLFLPLWAMIGVPVSVTAKYCVQAGATVQRMNRTSRLMIFLGGDILLLTLAYVLAYYLRFEIFLFRLEPSTYLAILPALFAVKLPVFYGYGLYRGMWRYTGMSDLRNIVMAVVISSVAIGVVMLLVNQFYGYSRAVFVLDGVFTLFLVGELVLRARAYNGPGIKETLQKLIPEYQPDLQAGSVMGLDPASLKSLRN